MLTWVNTEQQANWIAGAGGDAHWNKKTRALGCEIVNKEMSVKFSIKSFCKWKRVFRLSVLEIMCEISYA